jgi:hypothetical protein
MSRNNQNIVEDLWISILDGLSHIFFIIDGTYQQKLRLYHRQAIDTVLAYLSPDIKEKVEQQLRQKYYVSYMSDGRINAIFFKAMPDDLLLPDPAFADRLYKVEMFVNGRKQTANITFSRGRIFEVQFKKPHKFYKDKDIRFGAVTLGASNQSFTGAIDRLEHGKDGHIATGE